MSNKIWTKRRSTQDLLEDKNSRLPSEEIAKISAILSELDVILFQDNPNNVSLSEAENKLDEQIVSSKKVRYEKDKAKIEGKTYDVFCFFEDGSFDSFSQSNRFASLYGKKDEDFIPVRVEVVSVIDTLGLTSEGKKKFNDVYCGYYDFEKDEMSTSFIYSSLICTQLCFSSWSEPIKSFRGAFVELKVSTVREALLEGQRDEK